MLDDTTTAVQHPSIAHLGLTTTSWFESSSIDNPCCPYDGQSSCPTNRGQSRHDLISTMSTDCCSICLTAAAPSPIQLQAKHAPRVTPPIAHATCQKKDHTRNVYSSTIAKTAASTPEKLCPHTASAMNRQLWLRQARSALNAETPSQKKQKNRK